MDADLHQYPQAITCVHDRQDGSQGEGSTGQEAAELFSTDRKPLAPRNIPVAVRLMGIALGHPEPEKQYFPVPFSLAVDTLGQSLQDLFEQLPNALSASVVPQCKVCKNPTTFSVFIPRRLRSGCITCSSELMEASLCDSCIYVITSVFVVQNRGPGMTSCCNVQLCLSGRSRKHAPCGNAKCMQPHSNGDTTTATGATCSRVTVQLQVCCTLAQKQSDSVAQISMEYDPSQPRISNMCGAVLDVCQHDSKQMVVDAHPFQECALYAIVARLKLYGWHLRHMRQRQSSSTYIQRGESSMEAR
jgi:hypothetical protein